MSISSLCGGLLINKKKINKYVCMGVCVCMYVCVCMCVYICLCIMCGGCMCGGASVHMWVGCFVYSLGVYAFRLL